ncbi:Rnase Y domain-containing protein [Malacoplasma iowae]|uniref:Ribonuclease Y n=1 Tax=Malacoplasma iowae 695 TaxID=1048830 RepID=A0A6P1LGJ1_MALIO|nr:Rnase Y domain-containing protein [Malacoplasma iowae]VEU63082.1 Ribonuclease Y [Mycoplasmopsis fermentans]EGZ30971.1 hypothetical protein GUU_00262 [Malacoplasma iowae 695]QHG89521.1 Rnase Y domain-containing protein [Malacoplasma iowae 695]WPL35702.1 Rnase Y domain-containing protein [Malacoplasma iowae]VEU71825.1 Ribonuclease Y [Malacoplasma iowae]
MVLNIVFFVIIICTLLFFGIFAIVIFTKRKSRNNKRDLSTKISGKNISSNNENNIQNIYEKKNELDNLVKTNKNLKQQLELSLSKYNALNFSLKNKSENLDKQLQEISGLSKEEASKIILNNLKQELNVERSKMISNFETEKKVELENKARQILVDTMERMAEDIAISKTTYTIKLEEDNIKGRIIGKDGRNKKCFENTTGVELIIEKDPEVTISCLNPIRREIAKNLLEKLILNKNIEPSRIEKYYDIELENMNNRLYEIGKEALENKLQIFDVNKELYPYVGRLYFRTSFSQNNLTHAIECAMLASNIAIELNVDKYKAKKAAFFHDIGKSTDFEMDNDHVESGLVLARKYNLEDYIINAIESHHEKVPCDNIYSCITKIVDKISASRPGARHISHEEYLQKINTIEEICNSFDGVKNSYAIKAGKQVRVIIDPKTINDDALTTLAYDIKQKLETDDITNKQPIEIILIRENRLEVKSKGSASRSIEPNTNE